VPPTPAQYLNELGWDDGVAEFDRRERPGLDDLARIFGQKPTCYGQPGGSWGPQSFGALRKWGMPVYLDGGSHINLDNKPLYYCGILTLYKIDIVRTRLGGADDLAQTQEKFTAVRQRLQSEGGGIISIVYHPCEFVHKEFWDGVNFRGGANPPRDQWKLPREKTPEETRAAYQNFEDYIRFIQRFEDVKFITATEAATLWRDAAREHHWTPQEIQEIAVGVGHAITFQKSGEIMLAPSEVLQLLVNWLEIRLDGRKPPATLPPIEVTPIGPTSVSPPLTQSFFATSSDFRQAVTDVADALRKHGRVPSTVWLGSTGVPPEAFLAAAAKLVIWLGHGGQIPPQIEIRPATLAAAKFVADDDPQLWRWVIFPPGFRAPALMELAKKQAWTIKPAVMH
jgi:hypothetical protein